MLAEALALDLEQASQGAKLRHRSVYWRALKGNRRAAVWIVFLQVVSGLFEGFALTALVPLLYAGQSVEARSGLASKLIKQAGLRGEKASLTVLGAFLLLGLCSALFKLLSNAKGLKLRAGVERSMRERMTKTLLGMRWSAFLSARFGDINQSMLVEGNHTTLGADYALYAFGNLIICGAFVVLAFLLSAALTVFTLAFGAVVVIVYQVAGQRAEQHAQAQSAATASIAQHISDVFGNLKFFRSSGATYLALRRSSALYAEDARAFFLSQIYGDVIRFCFELVALLMIGAILGATILGEGRLTPESLVFLAVFYRLVPRMLDVQRSFNRAKTYRPWFLNWEERIQTASKQQDEAAGKERPEFNRSLSLDRVTFHHSEGAPVLSDISWTLEKGECLAFVGESGVGKTTMLDLVTGLLAPSSGKVLIDGKELTGVDLEAWRSRIGIVMQDSPLFHASVLENIAWLDPEPDRDKAVRCAHLAHAFSFIEALPDGLDALLGEKGANLSAGQRQRLALARALYRDPWLLILDEATSALDGASEAMVQQALESIKGRCSMLMVAHRLKTVQMADRIVVLVNGRIAEQGTWNELMSVQDGFFCSMADRQGLRALAM